MAKESIREKLCSTPLVIKAYYDEAAPVKEKNVGIFVHTLGEGGSQRAVEALIPRLERAGYGVYILSSEDGKYAQIYSENYGACVLVLDEMSCVLGEGRASMRLFDLVVINSFCSDMFSLYYADTEIPCIWWSHEGNEVVDNYIKNLNQTLIRSKNFVYAFPWVNPMSLWEQTYPEVKTAYLPIEVKDSYTGATNTGEKVRFFVPGSYKTYKGFHIALQAFITMMATGMTDFEAIFCGYDHDSEYYKTLEKACEKYSNIKLLGELDQSEMDEQFSEADCVVIPTTLDAGPLTAVEALMHKDILVISDAAGVSGIIQDCVNGFVYPSDNVVELYKRLIMVYHDKASLEGIAAGGRSIYEEFFASEAMDVAFDELMSEL